MPCRLSPPMDPLPADSHRLYQLLVLASSTKTTLWTRFPRNIQLLLCLVRPLFVLFNYVMEYTNVANKKGDAWCHVSFVVHDSCSRAETCAALRQPFWIIHPKFQLSRPTTYPALPIPKEAIHLRIVLFTRKALFARRTKGTCNKSGSDANLEKI